MLKKLVSDRTIGAGVAPTDSTQIQYCSLYFCENLHYDIKLKLVRLDF